MATDERIRLFTGSATDGSYISADTASAISTTEADDDLGFSRCSLKVGNRLLKKKNVF